MSGIAGVGPDGGVQKGGGLDALNLRILDVLRTNGRISMAALAEKVEISRATAYSRVEALVADGVITGFGARIDERKVGLSLSALVFVNVYSDSWPQFRETLKLMPEVQYSCVTTGEHDAMMLIRTVDVAAMHTFVIDVVAARPEIKAVVSVLVLDELVERPFVLPSDIPERTPAEPALGKTLFTRAGTGRSHEPG